MTHNLDKEYYKNDIEFEGQDTLELTAMPNQVNMDTRIRTSRESMSIFDLIHKIKREIIISRPDFQGFFIWNENDCSELIESILLSIPIPIIYLFENEEGQWQVIDGLNRITAIENYYFGNMKLKGLTLLPELNGMYFHDIPKYLQAKFEDYVLNTYIIQPPTPEAVKFIIFERINRGGQLRNKQEIRHALYQGKVTALLECLVNTKEFKLATGGRVNTTRMKDRYLVLRFISFYLLKTNKLTDIEYHSDMDSFLAFVMRFINNKASENLLEEIKSIFINSMRKIYEILGDNAFRFSPKDSGNLRAVNMGLFEMLTFAFSIMDMSKVHFKDVVKIVNDYKERIDKENTLTGNIDSKKTVDIRFDIAFKIAKG
ncbi:DUF262 domain-containing protein [Photobacterium profundum]|uniref:DUF262 domain-containing protein n=1 Tax=Photobacterium profundum TaxID=74109 RepID=UPI003D0D55A7